jgi:aspartate ammonia-lyase
VQLSGVLERVAVKLSKTCNDLRLLSSGPRSGLGEINLPAVQAGSSIMPGKVNPVIPEVVNQIAFAVIGHDLTVTMAAEAGQLQLNAFQPIIVHSLVQSVGMLGSGCELLASRCVPGITANADALRRSVLGSVGMVTALVPHIGYVRATELAQHALETGDDLIELVLAKGLLDRRLIDGLLGHPEGLARPHGRPVRE